jgi:inosine-uridine nucleoside N-ribohydrolase
MRMRAQFSNVARKVIIDTDPGVDDALAIFLALASPEINVIGLTTVFGNAHTSTTTRNALSLLELAGRNDIAVAMGASEPLASEYVGPPIHVHGPDGQGNANVKPPALKAINTPAPAWIYELASAAPGEVTILALGPLTNLALAVQQYPDLPALVDEVVVMGGNALGPGNASPAAESNMLHDPEAADIVFGERWRTTMIGLDVTHKVNLTSGDCGRSPLEKAQCPAILLPSILERDVWIPRDLPQMPVGILEIARIPAPKSLPCRFHDGGPGLFRQLHDRFDFGLRRDVVSERELRGAPRARQRQSCILGKALAWPGGELQALLQLEESNRAVFELLADDAVRLESESVAIEAE